MALVPFDLKSLGTLPPILRDWVRQLQLQVAAAAGGLTPWANVSKTGSNLNEIVTRNHVDTQNKQGGTTNEFYHLTAAQNTIVGTLAAGVYSPTAVNVANLDPTPTLSECQYMRVGATVTVSGVATINPTLAATVTQLGIPIPVASNFGAVEDCAGTAFAIGIAGQGAAIQADVANDRAQMQWVSGDITNQAMYFTFTYQII